MVTGKWRFRRIATGVNSSPASDVGVTAALNHIVSSFYFIELLVFDVCNETLNFQLVECKFFFFHDQ